MPGDYTDPRPISTRAKASPGVSRIERQTEGLKTYSWRGQKGSEQAFVSNLHLFDAESAYGCSISMFDLQELNFMPSLPW
jgi:hypothetical protein